MLDTGSTVVLYADCGHIAYNRSVGLKHYLLVKILETASILEYLNMEFYLRIRSSSFAVLFHTL